MSLKPRLKKIMGLWHCGIIDDVYRRKEVASVISSNPVGVGYTPLQAYDDWLIRELKA